MPRFYLRSDIRQIAVPGYEPIEPRVDSNGLHFVDVNDPVVINAVQLQGGVTDARAVKLTPTEEDEKKDRELRNEQFMPFLASAMAAMSAELTQKFAGMAMAQQQAAALPSDVQSRIIDMASTGKPQSEKPGGSKPGSGKPRPSGVVQAKGA